MAESKSPYSAAHGLEVGEPAADTKLSEPTRADGPWRTAPQGHRRRGCQERRRTTQLEQREGQTPSVQPASNFKEQRFQRSIQFSDGRPVPASRGFQAPLTVRGFP